MELLGNASVHVNRDIMLPLFLSCDVPHRACCSDILNTLILGLQASPVK
jgi:hypothetical protein